jgi:hypothetical protein
MEFDMRVMTRHYLVIGGVALAVVITAAALSPRAAKGAVEGGHGLQQCFRSSEIGNWVAPDPSTLYLRVASNRFYRVDLVRQCSPLSMPSAHLITHTFGPDLICGPVDWTLSASDQGPGGIPEPCFIKTITPLSPDQVAELPHNTKP